LGARVRRSDTVAARSPARHAQRRGQIYPEAAGTEQQLEEWQTAIENLINAAEIGSGWLMLARIGVMRALNRNVERVFNPNRKDHHWGRRKLARHSLSSGSTMGWRAGWGP